MRADRISLFVYSTRQIAKLISDQLTVQSYNQKKKNREVLSNVHKQTFKYKDFVPIIGTIG